MVVAASADAQMECAPCAVGVVLDSSWERNDECCGAAAFERVQRENLAVTRSTLDLAQSRQRIGVAQAADVIRWENELAVNRRAVIEAGARRRIAAISLHRLLHRPLEEPFDTLEAGPDDSGLLRAATFETYAGNAPSRRSATSPRRRRLEAAPELRHLDAAVAAGERAVFAARRALRRP